MNDPIPRIIRASDVIKVEQLDRERDDDFDEAAYRELIADYAELGFKAKSSGAKAFLCKDFTSLLDSRCALLGLRQTKLRVYVSLYLSDDAETIDGTDPLAALICLQELGLAAFGVNAELDVVEKIAPILAPYAHIPLFSTTERASNLPLLLEARINMLDMTDFSDKECAVVEVMAESFSQSERLPRPEDSPLLLADERQVYYLEEDFTLSEPIDCELDIPEQILEAEDSSFDALLFHIKNHDDAINFSQSSYMARCAVCFLAESEELLEVALMHYTGRAIIDSRSDLDDAAMEALAIGYGAIIR